MATVNDNDPRVEYTATASQTSFTRPFFLNAEADLDVYVNGMLVTSGYTHTGVGANSGTIVFSSGRTAGDIIILHRTTAQSRSSAYTNGQPLPASSLEDDNTRALLLEQEAKRDISRTIRAAVTETGLNGTTDLVLPAKADRANKFLVFAADGETLNPSAGTGTDTGLRADLASTADTTNGDALVSHYEGAGVGRAVRDILRDVVHVRNYVTGGSGTAGAPWTGWDTEIGTWEARRYRFTSGVYGFSTAPNWAVAGIHIDCEPGVTFKFTGAGTVAIKVDAGDVATNVFGVHITGFPLIQGSATTEYALHSRGVHHSHFQFRATDVTIAGLLVNFAVCNEYEVIVSSNEQTFTVQPESGMVLDDRADNEEVSWCTFTNPIIEGVSGAGIVMAAANGNVFIGGTSEGNAKGCTVSANCRVNTFQNTDFEANTVSDFEDNGQGTSLENCQGSSAGSSGTLIATGDGLTVSGGFWLEIDVDSNSFDTSLYGVGVGTGGITGSGAYTQDGCYNVNASNDRVSSILNPAFLAFNTVTDANVTGNNTAYTVVCDSEVYDKGANYNPATGVFTAARAGVYRFEAQVHLEELGTGVRFVEVRIVTSNRTYYRQVNLDLSGTYAANISVLADMDAADTAYMQVRADGVGADTADVFGDATGLYTFFSGKLEEAR